MPVDKAFLRERSRAQRAGLTDRAAQSAAIAAALQTLPEWQRARTVFSYIAVRDEVDVNSLLRELLAAGKKQLCAPRITGAGEMAAVPLARWDELQAGPHGLLQPPADREPVPPENIDLVLVPGLLFARNGARLGYGGGYYDRFLPSAQRACRVGLCYRELLVDRLPEENHEPRCTLVLTADTLLRCADAS